MNIQIFVWHYCTVMLSLSCANCSAQSVSNYSMPSARRSIQPEMMLISKKTSTHAISAVTSKLPTSWPGTCHKFVTYQNVLGVRKHIEIL